MTISSSAFENNGSIPQEYSCEGEGGNPPLEIHNVPPDAKALALIVDDPDAPVGLFTHWVLYNIPPNTTKIDRNSVPPGASFGKNSIGELRWIAPCPPSGMHHYQFQIYALSQPLGIAQGSDRDMVEKAIAQYEVDSAKLVGTYQKHS